MKIYCVCGFCGNHSSDDLSLEFNFRDSVIYFVCPKCKKENKMELKSPPKPLPRTRAVRTR
jgi:hypothetical protein